jgi:hypothetical protein
MQKQSIILREKYAVTSLKDDCAWLALKNMVPKEEYSIINNVSLEDLNKLTRGQSRLLDLYDIFP